MNETSSTDPYIADTIPEIWRVGILVDYIKPTFSLVLNLST